MPKLKSFLAQLVWQPDSKLNNSIQQVKPLSCMGVNFEANQSWGVSMDAFKYTHVIEANLKLYHDSGKCLISLALKRFCSFNLPI